MAPPRWTEDDLSRFEANSGRKLNPEAAKEMARTVTAKTRRNKFGAHATVSDGIRFDSKLEAKRYQELVLMERAGEILWFLRQVSFPLPGGVRWRADFVLVMPSLIPGAAADAETPTVRLRIEDCKGYDTVAGKNKIRQVEELYGVKVVLLRKAKAGRK